MVFFKLCRGFESEIPQTYTDGYMYFCTDTGNLYIDWADESGELHRTGIRPGGASDIPTHLPNPYAITFTGAINETYDGSSAKTINIPIVQGGDGETGVGISSIAQTTTSTEDSGANIVTISLTDGSSSTFQIRNGSKGSDGQSGVYILSDGETVDDAPLDAGVIIDPNYNGGSVIPPASQEPGYSGATQPDWNAAEGEPGCILNKPFGAEMGAILPECNLTYDESEGTMLLVEPFASPLIEGSEYVVNWNGTKQNTIAKSIAEDGVTMVALGNLSATGQGDDTGEPFVILEMPSAMATEMGVYAIIMALDGTTELTLSIEGEVVKKIDEKYIPDIGSALMYGGSDDYIYITEDTSNPANRMSMAMAKKIVNSGRQVYLVRKGDNDMLAYLLPVFAFTEQFGAAYTEMFGQSATAKIFYTAEYEQ